MIQTHFRRNDQSDILSVEISGHAESGPYGYDIVCAAISALSIGTVNSLAEIGGFTPLVETDEEEGGYLYVALPGDLSEQQWQTAQILLESLCLSCKSVSEEYPQYVAVQEKVE